MSISYFSELFDYDASVNRQVLDLLRGLPAVDERTQRVFAHILSTKRVWLSRLVQEDPGIAIWPDLNWDECETLIETNSASYQGYLSGLSEADLEEKAQYQNSKGVTFETPIRDILTHVLVHGGYHRGQIAVAVRDAGEEPINTDYITYVRALEAR